MTVDHLPYREPRRGLKMAWSVRIYHLHRSLRILCHSYPSSYPSHCRRKPGSFISLPRGIVLSATGGSVPRSGCSSKCPWQAFQSPPPLQNCASLRRISAELYSLSIDRIVCSIYASETLLSEQLDSLKIVGRSAHSSQGSLAYLSSDSVSSYLYILPISSELYRPALHGKVFHIYCNR